MKNILILLFILTSSLSILGNEEVDLFQENLDKFETNCIDQDDNLREDIFVSDEMYSCKKELEYLKYEFERRENLMTQNPEVFQQYKNCVESRNNPKVSKLAEFGEEVSEELSCNEVDKAKHEKECSTAMQCNALRSVLDGIDILPRALEKPVKNFVRGQAKKKGYSDECMSDDKSNCLEDFTNALIDNLWSTATSILSLAKSGFSSLFSMTGFFDKQSDKALTAMKQSKEDVNSFLDSPGKWMVDFYNNLVTGVQSWIKSSVFCQKWVYNDELEARGASTGNNSGVLRTCVEPLKDFSCVDCDDVINATCVGLGALTAELGVAFFTAGAGTVASFTTKASAKALAIASSKTSAKIKSIAPKLSKSAKKTKKKPSKVSVYATKMATNAKLAISVTSAQAVRLKGKIDNAKALVANTKVVRVTSEIIEKANFPARISEKVGESATVLVAKGASKVAGKTGANTIKKEADLIVKASTKSSKSARARDLLDENNHSKKRVVTHTSQGTKAYSRGQSVNSSPIDKPSVGSRSGNDKDLGSGNVSSNTESKTSKVTSAGEQNSQLTSHSSSAQNKEPKSSRSVKPQDEHKTKTADRKERERIQREKENKLAQERKQQQHQQREEEKSKATKLAVAGVATSLAAKGINVSKEQAERELEQLERYSKGEKVQRSKNLNDAKKVLGVEGKSAFSNSTLETAQNIKEMYSDKNKNSIVDNMMKSDPSMSRDQANNAFNKRQDSVNQAYNYINNTVSKTKKKAPSAREKQISQLENELKKVKSEGEMSSINSELEELRQQRADLENSSSTETVISSPTEASNVAGVSSYRRPSSVSTEVDKPVARRPRASSSQISSSTLPASSASAGNSGAGASFSQTSSGANKVDSLEDSEFDASVSQIDSLHEALEEVSPELENQEELEKEGEIVARVEPEERKKSKNLKDLLGLISKKGMVVENDILIKDDLSSVKSSGELTERKLNELKRYETQGIKADKLVTYQVEDGKLRVYHFGEKTYPIATNNEGLSSLINEDVSKSLIERAIGQVE